jgi:hypothetical protein
MIVRRFDVLSVTKVGGALYAAMGLVIGAVISVVALVGAASSPATYGGGPRFFGLLFGVGAVLLLPVLYGILGAITSGLGALLYNAIAKHIGGISFELAPEAPAVRPPAARAVAG